MKFHVLPGDNLAEIFKDASIEGEIIVCRECLIVGEVKAEDLKSFWQARAEFISAEYGEVKSVYQQTVVAEFEKLQNLRINSEINLWFEYELFCQVNMWFCLSLLKEKPLEVYRVLPVVRNEKDIWKGFSNLDKEDLENCFEKRIKLNKNEITLGANLWSAYQNKDFRRLTKLGETESECFPKLREVCQAEIEKSHRPQKALKDIISTGETDFGVVFQRFTEKQGIYGFGDLQIKKMYQEVLN